MSFFAMEIWCLGCTPENLRRSGGQWIFIMLDVFTTESRAETANKFISLQVVARKFVLSSSEVISCWSLRSTAIRKRFWEYSVELWKLIVSVCVSIFSWSVWCNELRSVWTHQLSNSFRTSSIWRYAAMPSSFFQASATYFALDESCNMLYLRLTGSTTLKPKGRCSVQKPGSSRGFCRKFPWSWRRAFGFATRLGRWVSTLHKLLDPKWSVEN